MLFRSKGPGSRRGIALSIPAHCTAVQLSHWISHSGRPRRSCNRKLWKYRSGFDVHRALMDEGGQRPRTGSKARESDAESLQGRPPGPDQASRDQAESTRTRRSGLPNRRRTASRRPSRSRRSSSYRTLASEASTRATPPRTEWIRHRSRNASGTSASHASAKSPVPRCARDASRWIDATIRSMAEASQRRARCFRRRSRPAAATANPASADRG